MQKHLIFIGLSTLLLTSCNQESNQANILNTQSVISQHKYDITLPSPKATESLIDDEKFFSYEKKNIIDNMHDLLRTIQKNPNSDDVKKLTQYQQNLFMTDLYEKSWQKKMKTLQEQIIQLESIVQDKKDGLERTIIRINEILDKIAI